MKTFAIHTLGCKVNSYESEAYISYLLKLGYQQVSFKEKADLYLINTCAVTNTASSKSRQKIHQAIAQNKDAYIAVIGCYSQAQSESIAEIPGVCAVVGSDHKNEFLDHLDEYVNAHSKVNLVHDLKDPVDFEELNIEKFSHHTRAFLKIQDGCNQFCSYCIIPYTRGRERSLPEKRVIELSNQLVNNGHSEIVLAGIHTGRYGNQLQTNLTTLLKKMLEIKQLKRIRISSIEMNEISDELIDLMKNEKRIAHHLHIPIQSACDSVLKRMHRPYSVDDFKNKVKWIRSQIEDISISTDIIAGFPEESDFEHQQTIKNLNDIQFSFMHVFPYSKRDNTLASKMEQVHGTIKKSRTKELSELSEKYRKEYYQSFVSKKCEVIVERYENGVCMGHSSEYVPVKFMGNKEFVGKCILVKINDVCDSYCFGSLEV
ncbi:MAG: tRNA (N(6)-L-threonylcarbamoyladenosine(37)-C(2))-methylthiotransferase MtaB [Traorella sp.]